MKRGPLFWFAAICMALAWVATIASAVLGGAVHWWNWVGLVGGSLMIAFLSTPGRRSSAVIALVSALCSVVSIIGSVMHL